MGRPKSKQLSVIEQLAIAWGVARPYMYKVKKEGCPVELAEGEDIRSLITRSLKWRHENAKFGVGIRSDLTNPQNAMAAGVRGAYEKPNDGPVEPMDVSTLEASLKTAIEVERICAEEVQRFKGKPAQMLTAINVYNKAQANRMATEKTVMALKLKRGTLVTIDDAKLLINRQWGTFITRLRACARNCASRANPQDDVRAEREIRLEIETAIADAQKAYGK